MSIPLPPLPSLREWPHSHEELRARDLEVARVVLEAAAEAAGPARIGSEVIADTIRALEFHHAE